MLRPPAIAALLAVAVSCVVLWMLVNCGPVEPAIGSPAAQVNRPSDRPGPEVVPLAKEVERVPDGAAERTSGMPPEATISFDDRIEKRVQKAKEASGLGSLADDEMRSLLNLVVSGEQSAIQMRDGYMDAGGDHRSFEYADLDFSVEGWTVRALAIMEGSYVLVPIGESLSMEILGDPDVHIVTGPGGKRGDKTFQTHIIIDLQRHGRFAASKNHYEKMIRDKNAAAAANARK